MYWTPESQLPKFVRPEGFEGLNYEDLLTHLASYANGLVNYSKIVARQVSSHGNAVERYSQNNRTAVEIFWGSGIAAWAYQLDIETNRDRFLHPALIDTINSHFLRTKQVSAKAIASTLADPGLNTLVNDVAVVMDSPDPYTPQNLQIGAGIVRICLGEAIAATL